MSGKDVKDEKKEEEKQRAKDEKKEEKKEERKAPVKKIAADVQGIVRFAGTDLDGTKKLRIALLKVKGIGQPFSLAIPRAAGIDPDATMGKLTEEQLMKLENVLKDPAAYGLPAFMLNRQSDTETNQNSHLSGSELALRKKFDIDFLKRIRCYKGIRHELGLPVRGQRTRSSFRTGARVGVVKKALPGAAPKPGAAAPAAAAPAAPAKGAAPAKAAPAAPAKKQEEKPAEKK